MQQIINTILTRIEGEEDVKVIYACESGSRAWGFPSSDSDYDIRFIYIRPINWYLSIHEGRDVIVRPIDGELDIHGWDLRKALRLLRKSNPALLEWLGSSIVYHEHRMLVSRLRQLAQRCFSPTACAFNYLHTARHNYESFLQWEPYPTKKYFYALRSALAINWLERDKGIVPTDFRIMVDQLVADPTLRLAIDRLLAAKEAGTEAQYSPRIEPISQFIELQLERWETRQIASTPVPGMTDALDGFFLDALKGIWGSQFGGSNEHH